MANAPDNIITQVSQDDDGLIDEEADDQPGFFSRIFCCCFSSSNRREQAYELEPAQVRSVGEALLTHPAEQDRGRQTLVLDLDETLVHSSFKPIANADFIIPVEIEDQVHQVYVVKRPGVDQFMKKCGEHFEVVVFTASLAKYADPVLDLLDKHRVVRARLFREACSNHKGTYVKDMGRLGRDIRKIIIIDNSPASYLWHPQNAIAIISWFDDANDTELYDMLPFLEDITKVEDVREVLDGSIANHHHKHLERIKHLRRNNANAS